MGNVRAYYELSKGPMWYIWWLITEIKYLNVVSTSTVYLYFNSYSIIVDDRPEVKFLNRHLREQLCAKNTIWKDLGVELLGDGSNDALEVIKNNSSDVMDRCSAMFQLWLDRQPTASWKKLIQALEKVQLNYLANQIESKLTKPYLEHTTGMLCKYTL